MVSTNARDSIPTFASATKKRIVLKRPATPPSPEPPDNKKRRTITWQGDSLKAIPTEPHRIDVPPSPPCSKAQDHVQKNGARTRPREPLVEARPQTTASRTTASQTAISHTAAAVTPAVATPPENAGDAKPIMNGDNSSSSSEEIETPMGHWDKGTSATANSATLTGERIKRPATNGMVRDATFIRNPSLKEPQYSLQMINGHHIENDNITIVLHCLWGNGDTSLHKEKDVQLIHNSAVNTYWDQTEGGRPDLDAAGSRGADFLRVLASRGPKSATEVLVQRVGRPVSDAHWEPLEDAFERWPSCKRRIVHSLNYLSIGKKEYDPSEVDYINGHRVVLEEENGGRAGKKRVMRLEMSCVLAFERRQEDGVDVRSRVEVKKGEKKREMYSLLDTDEEDDYDDGEVDHGKGSHDSDSDNDEPRGVVTRWIAETRLHKKHNGAVLTYLNTSPEARATWEEGAQPDYRVFRGDDGIKHKISQHVCRILGHRQVSAASKANMETAASASASAAASTTKKRGRPKIHKPKPAKTEFLTQWSGYSELERMTNWRDGRFLQRFAPHLYFNYCEMQGIPV